MTQYDTEISMIGEWL